MAKKQHPRTKGDKTPKSKNYIKQSRKVGKLYRKIKAQRLDENEKLSTVLVRHFRVICLETLNVKGMMSNHRLAKAVSDNSPYALKEMIKENQPCEKGLLLRRVRSMRARKPAEDAAR